MRTLEGKIVNGPNQELDWRARLSNENCNGIAKSVDWVDTCKGLGIYLVVLGHAHINPTLQHFIYLFHMPLFFFLSGYLHTIKKNFRDYGKKKMVQLLLPYACFLLLLYPQELVSIFCHKGFGRPLTHALFAALWGGHQLQGFYGAFWFLPCLFFTQQSMNFLLARFRLATVTSLVFLGLLLSYANARFAPQFSLPLDANVLLAAMPFFYLGFVARSLKRDHRIIIVLGASGAALGAYLQFRSVPVFYNMRDGVYGIPGLSFVLASCCITCMVVISKLSATIIPVQRVFGRLGAASMGIMFIHKQLPLFGQLKYWDERHGYIGSILLLAISFLITWLLRRAALTRALLLGSETDFRHLLANAYWFSKWKQGRGEAGLQVANTPVTVRAEACLSVERIMRACDYQRAKSSPMKATIAVLSS